MIKKYLINKYGKVQILKPPIGYHPLYSDVTIWYKIKYCIKYIIYKFDKFLLKYIIKDGKLC